MSIDLWKIGARRVAYSPADEAGGGESGAGAAGAAGAGGEGGDGGAAGAAGAAAGAGAGDGSAGAGGGAGAWWEDKRFSDDQRQNLTALGLTVDDPLEAVARLTDMERAAKKRLGAKPDSLMPKPAEGQSLAEWRREHAKTFQIPDDAAGYKIDRPDSWPKDAPWNDKLEGAVREVAAKHAADPELIQDLTSVFAGNMAGMVEETETELAASSQQMMQELEGEWGDQMAGNLSRARQAATAIAEEAGFTPAHMQQLSNTLAKGTGDANVIKLFATIGKMMGEDSFTAGAGGGGSPLGQTPAEARAELSRLQARDGEWYKAVAAKDRTELERLKPRMEALRKLASPKKPA